MPLGEALRPVNPDLKCLADWFNLGRQPIQGKERNFPVKSERGFLK